MRAKQYDLGNQQEVCCLDFNNAFGSFSYIQLRNKMRLMEITVNTSSFIKEKMVNAGGDGYMTALVVG